MTQPTQLLLWAGGFSEGEVTKTVSVAGVKDAHDLFCTQEEADTRMILHAMHANRAFADLNAKGTVVIKSSDTDVLVLALHYFPQMDHIDQMWIETGVITAATDLRRYIPVHQLCGTLSSEFCQILPAAHALTGCDSVSSFFWIGKKTVFKVLITKGARLFSDLCFLSADDVGQATDAARKFVSTLYDQDGKLQKYHEDLNELRMKLATTKDKSLSQLPPCEDSFRQHVQRASWQTKVWMSSHLARPDLGSPDGHGWRKEDENLLPVFFEGPMASELLQDLICSCTPKSHCTRNCTCHQNNLTCTELCTCQGTEECGNLHTHRIDIDEHQSTD
jgi:hypothetical protein